jgi:hypothetical protein
MLEEIRDKISLLVESLNRLEIEITIATDVMKDYYVKASYNMPDGKSYFLNGVQTGPVVKSYLLTRQGIEVPGEESMQIPEFIENVLRFANYPKRRVEVLGDLLTHLEKIHLLNQEAEV